MAQRRGELPLIFALPVASLLARFILNQGQQFSPLTYPTVPFHTDLTVLAPLLLS